MYSLLEWGFLRHRAGAMSTGIIILFAAIGALTGAKRDLASGFGVLFAGMGGFAP